MPYRLIILDIDGTITRHISSWRYIHEKLGLWTNRAFRYQEAFLAGRISYRRFCELDAAHWKGMRESRIRRIFASVAYSRNAARCIGDLRRKGFKLAAISTGLQYIPERLQREFDFDYILSNRLLSRNGVLTGGVGIKIAHGAKHTVLKRIFRKFRVMPHEVISVGDSDGDIPLARDSGYSIAFNSSSKKLSKIADYNCRTRDFREVYRKILEISKIP